MYFIILAAQIMLLSFSIRKKTKKLWIGTFMFEIISAIIAFVLMWYYNSLPGYGFMPGLSYFEEVLFSMVASFLYAIMLAISFIVFLFVKKRQRKNS
jgi:hypothetical protein